MKKIVKKKTRIGTAKLGKVRRRIVASGRRQFLRRVAERSHSSSFDMCRSRINTGYFSIRKIVPRNASCHACAIIPGRRLLRHHASNPNINP